jgi:FkbM family methyltransferase
MVRSGHRMMYSAAQRVLNLLARAALRVRFAERALVAGVRNPTLRRHLRLGAIALRYPPLLRRRELRIAVLDGYRLWVNVGEHLGVSPYFFGDPCVAWVTQFLVRQGDVCVDAGANAGFYTFFCASVVGPGGRVFAFEPNPEFASLLERSVCLNSFSDIVRVVPRALFSQGGEIKRLFVSVNPMNSGTSSLVDHGVFLDPRSTVEVATMTFDQFARDERVRSFRLVKIDVERAEEFVLLGASETLAAGRIDFLIVEMNAGSRAQQLLEDAGYRGYQIAHDKKALVRQDDVPSGSFGDFLFVRPGLELPPLDA